jgi:hypothetical protein
MIIGAECLPALSSLLVLGLRFCHSHSTFQVAKLILFFDSARAARVVLGSSNSLLPSRILELRFEKICAAVPRELSSVVNT